MRQVKVSAPGKIHLMGEHAVVYGNPALLSAINKRLTITLSETGSHVEYPDKVKEIITLFRRELAVENLPIPAILIHSEIRSGFHLGSSAAFSVALAAAFLFWHTNSLQQDAVNELAFMAEKVFHGNPSGGDNAICTYGGFVRFQKGEDGGKSIEHIAMKHTSLLSNFFLVNSGRPESTKTMIQLVADRFASDESMKQTVLSMNEDAFRTVLQGITEGVETKLIQGIRDGHSSLVHMGVVSPSVMSFIGAIEKAGGAAKILGGGGNKKGSGYLLVYHPDIVRVKCEAQRFKFAVENVALGAEGVRIEQA